MQQYHLAAALLRGLGNKVDELANGIDANRLALLLWRNAEQIGMTAGLAQQTATALLTSLAASRLITHQPGSKGSRKRALAGA